MKKFALFAAAALIASPAVFAADKDLCQLNLQEIDDNMATNKATLGDPARGEVQDLIKKARDAKQSETCIAQSTKALQMLEGPGSTGSTGSAGTGSGASN